MFCEIWFECRDDYLFVFVQDTGIGILKEKKMLFLNFSQANDTYAEKNHGGTGWDFQYQRN
jgi:signal transduction histidine kinase